MSVCLQNTNKMYFSSLLYVNNLSPTHFEHSNYSSLIKPVYHDARSTEWEQNPETFLSNSAHLYSSNKMLCQTEGFPFCFGTILNRLVFLLRQHSAQRDALRPNNKYKLYLRKSQKRLSGWRYRTPTCH